MVQGYIDLQGHIYTTLQTGSTIVILDVCSGNLLIGLSTTTSSTVTMHLLLAMMWQAVP